MMNERRMGEEESGGGGIVWMEELKLQPSNSNTNTNEEEEEVMVKMKKKKRKARSIKRKEFIGWGSKQVIEFLQSIETNTTEMNPISQNEVTDIINKYIMDNNLIHPGKGKKKRVLCDPKLHALFGRKSISRIKIYDLLESHFAENLLHDDLDDDDLDDDDDLHVGFGFSNNNNNNSNNNDVDNNNDAFLYTSWDEETEADADADDNNSNIILHKNSCCSFIRKSHKHKTTTSPKFTCFAALIPHNLNLIYLRKCVVEDILKVELELNQTFQCKLVGSFVRIKSDPNDYLQTNSHMLLQVTGVKKASGTESDDMNTEILLQVANSIQDVRIHMLSDDYFSEEELEDLRRRIKDGSLKRPTVVELEQKAQILHQDITKHWIVRELSLLQNLIDRANEKGWRRELFEYLDRRHLLQTPSEQSRLLLEVPKVIAEEIAPEATVQNSQDNVDENRSPRSILREVSETPVYNFPMNGISSTEISGRTDAAVQEQQQQPAEIRNKGVDEGQSPKVANEDFQVTEEKQVIKSQVIDLSDDEEIENLNGRNEIIDDHSGSSIWHYMDPQGDVQGPFSLMSLKCWSDADYFPPGFKVWKTGQSHADALLLSDLLHLMFPG